MKPLALPLLCVGLLGALTLSQERIQNGLVFQDSVEWGAIILPTDSFTSNLVEKKLRDVLVTKDPRAKVLKVFLMDNDDSTDLDEMGGTENGYSFWQFIFQRKYQTRIPPFAEIVAIGENAAIRIRDRQGHVSTKILKGKSPYLVDKCGADISVVHLAINRSRTGKTFEDWYVSLHFFLRTSSLVNEQAARCALEELSRATSQADIIVSLRNDSWFIIDSDFPVVLPYLTTIAPPTEIDFNSQPRVDCFLIEGRIKCQYFQGHKSIP